MNLKEQREQLVRDHRLAMNGIDSKFDEALGKINAQIAEAENPKLRHGDYGIDETNERFVVAEQSTLVGSPKAFYADQGGQRRADEHIPSKYRLGNIFDDLKALQEEVTEFDLGKYTGYWSGVGCLVIKDAIEKIVIEPDSINEFIRKLSQMWATQKRQAK